MKTKAKLLLAISTLSAVVLAAGVTSTFAWFTTQTTANLNTGTMTVSTVSSITVNVTKLAYKTTTPETGSFGNDVQSVVDKDNALGVVSSIDGLNFYAPKTLRTGVGSDVYVAGDFASIGTESDWTYSNKYVGYVKYGVTVKAGIETGATRELKYKFTVTAGTKMVDAYRVAFYKATSASAGSYTPGALIGIYSNTTGAKTGRTTAGATAAYVQNTVALPTSKTSLSPAVSTSASDPILEHYIVSVWLEGEDASAINTGANSISGQEMSLDLEFSLN